MSGASTPFPLQNTPAASGAGEEISRTVSQVMTAASGDDQWGMPPQAPVLARRVSQASVSSESAYDGDTQNTLAEPEAQCQIRDRKRRLTSTSDVARLPRTYSSGMMESEPEATRMSLHRSMSELQSGSSQIPGTSYGTAIDITSSPSEGGAFSSMSRMMPGYGHVALPGNHPDSHPARRYQTWHTSIPAVQAASSQPAINSSRKPLPWAPPPRRSSQSSSGDTWSRGLHVYGADRSSDDNCPDNATSEDLLRFGSSMGLSMHRVDQSQYPRLYHNGQRTLDSFGWGAARSGRYSETAMETSLSSPSIGTYSGPDIEETSEGLPEFSEAGPPRWQPDEEVTSCPICGTVFNFWHRKHHCRKCGRVVCASCSPHLIVIPRQYIVRPPDALNSLLHSSPADLPSSPSHLHSSPAHQPPVVDLTREGPHHLFDPSTNPALGGGEKVRLCNPCVPDPNPNPLGYGFPRVSTHRSTHSVDSMGHRQSRVAREGASHRQERRTLGSTDRPSDLPGLDHHVRRSTTATTVRSSPTVPGASVAVAPRRPEVSEDDMCPVCGRIFPPLDNEHTQEAREEHVRECIENYGASPTIQAERAHVDLRQAPPPPPQPSTSLPAAPRMLSFTASEKDCVGENGEVGECSICFEDYEAGQILARLKCLCKFHKACIDDWFERKMECPVHKV
ncbi:Uncharacterized protein PECH_005753 [Penicillium ucsense]|uniref:RING-type E3 ubiquitin transferase n=1 Tax=Penicillium ucsense TaxID=2839758 RepID=A0A8J8WHD4_9EURO|nr:Uncharacterized protein PECM_006230 [Penicillium ucsense]KAF7736166.1 Uncharacterized protein PECH_005753 [Penicillium ucsense]